MKLLFRIIPLLLVLIIILSFNAFAADAKENVFYYAEINPQFNTRKDYFYSKVSIAAHSEEEKGYLSSYAAASCTEFKNASASDLRAETHIANEMEDSIFANLYLQTAYVEIEIALESGEKYTEASYTMAASEGSSCVLTASDMHSFKANDTIKYFASQHFIFIGFPRFVESFPSGHPNNVVRIYHSHDYFKYN